MAPIRTTRKKLLQSTTRSGRPCKFPKKDYYVYEGWIPFSGVPGSNREDLQVDNPYVREKDKDYEPHESSEDDTTSSASSTDCEPETVHSHNEYDAVVDHLLEESDDGDVAASYDDDSEDDQSDFGAEVEVDWSADEEEEGEMFEFEDDRDSCSSSGEEGADSGKENTCTSSDEDPYGHENFPSGPGSIHGPGQVHPVEKPTIQPYSLWSFRACDKRQGMLTSSWDNMFGDMEIQGRGYVCTVNVNAVASGSTVLKNIIYKCSKAGKRNIIDLPKPYDCIPQLYMHCVVKFLHDGYLREDALGPQASHIVPNKLEDVLNSLKINYVRVVERVPVEYSDRGVQSVM